MTIRPGLVVPLLISTAALVLAGCSASADGSSPSASPASADPAAASSSYPREIPYSLSTHCGIDEAFVAKTFFEAEKPLNDGSGNPPAGWDNPFQQGTMTLVSPTKAVFSDEAGHEVTFRARQGAKDFKQFCD